jgi:hypothetical protein
MDVDRHGNVRTYFWRKGRPKIRIREEVGSQAFLDVYRRRLSSPLSARHEPAGGRNLSLALHRVSNTTGSPKSA